MKSAVNTVLAAAAIALVSPLLHAADVAGDARRLVFSALPDKTQYIDIHGPESFFTQTSGHTIEFVAPLADGQYRYLVFGEMQGRPARDQYKQTLNNGRSENKRSNQARGVGQLEMGYFRISNGKLLTSKDEKEK